MNSKKYWCAFTPTEEIVPETAAQTHKECLDKLEQHTAQIKLPTEIRRALVERSYRVRQVEGNI